MLREHRWSIAFETVQQTKAGYTGMTKVLRGFYMRPTTHCWRFNWKRAQREGCHHNTPQGRVIHFSTATARSLLRLTTRESLSLQSAPTVFAGRYS